MRKYVVSTTLDEAEWNNSLVVEPDALVDTVTKLRQEPGGDVLVNGSARSSALCARTTSSTSTA